MPESPGVGRRNRRSGPERQERLGPYLLPVYGPAGKKPTLFDRRRGSTRIFRDAPDTEEFPASSKAVSGRALSRSRNRSTKSQTHRSWTRWWVRRPMGSATVRGHGVETAARAIRAPARRSSRPPRQSTGSIWVLSGQGPAWPGGAARRRTGRRSRARAGGAARSRSIRFQGGTKTGRSAAPNSAATRASAAAARLQRSPSGRWGRTPPSSRPAGRGCGGPGHGRGRSRGARPRGGTTRPARSSAGSRRARPAGRGGRQGEEPVERGGRGDRIVVAPP